MNNHLCLAPLVALFAGIVILAVPRLRDHIVAIHLMVVGATGILAAGSFNFL